MDKLYEVDPQNMAWVYLSTGTELGTSPGPRYALGAASDSEIFYIFGGFSTWVTDLNGSGE